jgi:aspartate/methionine/tyrosine aminotransferase
MLSLPGLKAGWMAVEGGPSGRARFLNATEYLSDTFLPVSEFVQAAIPRLLNKTGLQETTRFVGLLKDRMKEFVSAWQAGGVDGSLPEAGPYLPLHVPRLSEGDDEALALKLVTEAGILLHPGSLYDLAAGHLVTTCIASPPWPIEQIACSILR